MGRAAAAIGVALALSALACSIDDRAITAREPAIFLRPDLFGSVNGNNAADIRGSWFGYVDTGDCLASGPFTAEQCSQLFTPVGASSSFIPSDVATGRMCTAGIAARVIAGAVIWGAGILFDFNTIFVDDPYDAAAHMLTGISFEIDAPPADAMAIVFPTSENPNTGPWWGGATNRASPVVPGFNMVRWADVGGPNFQVNPPPFDPRHLLKIQFQVVPNEQAAVPFEFCVSNLAVRTD
jgi:hypothetical protein